MASSSPSNGSNSPPLASKQDDVEDGVFLAEEFGDGLFQLFVQLLRAADEAHAGKAIALLLEALMGRLNDLGMIGEAEVVVGAEVDYFVAADRDGRALRRLDQPLALVETGLLELFELGAKMIAEFEVAHGDLL